MRAKPTSDRLHKLIAHGYGSGYLDTYQPWLRIHRKNASPTSNQIVARLPGYTRQAHFFARVEWYVALLCLWLGAFDVREQFPLWPMRHKHPLAFKSAPWKATEVDGLWQIAEEAGIRHGTEIGSDGVPYVATMDLMVTIDDGTELSLAGLSLKPHSQVTAAEPTDRLVERQELERRYMLRVHGHYVVVDSSLVSLVLRTNLDACARFASTQLDPSPQVRDFLSCLRDLSQQLEQRRALRLAARYADLPWIDAQQLLMAAIWRRAIDVDITQAIRPDLPLSFGGNQIAQVLQKELFGRSYEN